MTHQGIWIKPRFHVSQGSNEVYTLFMNYQQGTPSFIHSSATVRWDDADTYAVALRKFFTEVWGLSVCSTCKYALTPPGSSSCASCSKFTAVRMHVKDLECVICKEPAEQVRKPCGTCGQAICMSCWYDYTETTRAPICCPHCKQQYHKLKRKREANEVSESDED